jgi:hypothetical protein
MSSTDLNRIRRYPITAVFGLYIVSGVLKDGTLRVTWNSGIDAAEQMDYGVGDDSVPNTTDWTRLKKGEKGYIEGENKRKFRKNHIINFPKTFVDTYHYFRVRSENQKGDVLESEIFQVYVTDKTIQRSYMASVQVRVEPVSVSNEKQAAKHNLETSVEGSTEPEISTDDNGSVSASKDEKDVTTADENQPVKSTFETNITTTVT